MAFWKLLTGSSLILLGTVRLGGQTVASSSNETGTIQGVVLYADGTPAHTGKGIPEEVAVNVEIQTPTGAWARFGGAAHTDEQGHYQIEGLPAGKYIVFAALPGQWMRTSAGMIKAGGPIFFAPGVVRPSQAQVVTLSDSGNAKEANLRVPRDSHHRVSGRVLTANGEAVSRGIVRLFPSEEPALSRTAPLSEDGSFEFSNVADEEYTVLVSCDGWKPGAKTAQATVTVTSGNDPEQLRLVLPAANSR